MKHPYNSVHGCGRRGPDYKNSIFMENGLELPGGGGPMIDYKEGDPKTKSAMNRNGTFLLSHNEFIVYDTNQVRMRYLLQVVKKTKEELEKEKLAKYGL